MIAIGPAVEVFLTAVGLILLLLFGVGLAARPFWPRIAAYFRRWHERDMRLEQQQREEAECRQRAQQEICEYCHDDILQGAVPLTSNSAAPTPASAASPAQTASAAQTTPSAPALAREYREQPSGAQQPMPPAVVQRIGLESNPSESKGKNEA